MKAGTEALMGVVLCGGESRRMGRDKGLIEWEGVTWAARVGTKLSTFGLPVVYSVRDQQEEMYSVALPEAVLVLDSLDIGGPLNGLLSVHRRFPGRDLLLLACDMQEMDEGTIGELIEEYAKGGAESYAYYEGGFVQPFCAIYTADGLGRMDKKSGGRRSLREVIENGVIKRLEVRRKKAFVNYNLL